MKKANDKAFVRGVEDIQQQAWVNNDPSDNSLYCDLDDDFNNESATISKLVKSVVHSGTGELGLTDKYRLQGQLNTSEDPNV